MAHPGAADLAKESYEQVRKISEAVKSMSYKIESTLTILKSEPTSTFGNKI